MRKNLKVIEPLFPSIDFVQLEEIALNASEMVQSSRSHMLAPDNVKEAPLMTTNDICEVLGMSKTTFNYHYTTNEHLPRGVINKNKREFTMSEAKQWITHLDPSRLRNPTLSAGCTIAVVNYKGGVTKTTTVATLAQGLCRRGMKVLVIDLDPQGSCTALFGMLSDIDVDEEATVMPLYGGAQPDVMSAIRPTYWEGIDIIAAAPCLYGAEFLLPARQRSERGFEFWKVLDAGLDPARDVYDVIIIDSPPALSYTTINAMLAADGIMIPMPPSTLDFASSAQFWNLGTDLIKTLYKDRGAPDKKYHFINVMLSKVDAAVGVTSEVRKLIYTAYGAMVMPVEIPKTSAAETASISFGTVYDLAPGSVLAKTLKRAKDAYEEMVDFVEAQIRGVWLGQIQTNSKEKQ